MRIRPLATALGLISLPALLSCGSKAPACQGVTTACTGFEEGASEATVSAGFAQAQPGATLAFAEGTFSFKNSLSLSGKNLTLKGAGQDKTILDFSGQAAGADAISVLENSDGFVARDLTIRDTKGNALKVLGSVGVTFKNVKVIWTNPSGATHGSYGLYPVQSKNVLIDTCTVSGAADAGIYVGQSQNIVVKNSTATKNVAGIEIENSFNADVHDNTATDNTAGILVFDLPNLQQQGGHNVRVYNNVSRGNNRTNFGAVGSTVGLVPAGTGFLVMANHDVEVFGNTFADNNTGATGVFSYFITQIKITDQNYYPFPSKIHIHDNVMTNNGTSPDQLTGIGGLFLFAKDSFTGHVIPGELYDGIVDPNATGGLTGNSMTICFKNNGSATFANLHLDQLNDQGNNLGTIKSEDATNYTCSLPPLPEVTLP
jgi:parallel beta-helix repeat protein